MTRPLSFIANTSIVATDSDIMHALSQIKYDTKKISSVQIDRRDGPALLVNFIPATSTTEIMPEDCTDVLTIIKENIDNGMKWARVSNPEDLPKQTAEEKVFWPSHEAIDEALKFLNEHKEAIYQMIETGQVPELEKSERDKMYAILNKLKPLYE